MEYISQSLTFEENEIIFSNPNYENEIFEVMMDWEDTLMSASAAYVCEGGGDILEIGFGMHISADYIQSHTINSHTIIENHPDIIPKANEWAANKPNVTIVEGDWYDVKDTLSTYDGLFYDTYGDYNIQYFADILPSLMKEGGRATWWNGVPSGSNFFGLSNITYDVYDINPPQNSYFNHNKYYLPKKQF
jgi:protein arginine N-methyltransferase 2